MPKILVPVNMAGQFGITSVTDVSPAELALNVWTAGRNVRMRDGAVEKMLGHVSAFGTPTVAPYFAIPLSVADGNTYWVYAGLNKIYSFDGSSHDNITRQVAAVDSDYSASANLNWTGGKLGGILLLNNGVDAPQFWTGTGRADDLTNWPASTTARALRVFRRYLVALDITKSGTRYPQMIKWSDIAPTGAVPGSWDETDETIDAGEYEVKDTDGAVIDMAPMRDDQIIYKEDSCIAMQFIGGVDIFAFPKVFDSFGILSRRCAVEYAKGRHAVFALGDLITHDGQTWDSIVGSRLRKWIFNQMDPSNYLQSFVASNPARYEVWFCFPTLGSSVPNLAVVWNWRDNTLGVRDISAAHIEPGNVALTEAGDLWDNDSLAWDSDTTTWDEGNVSPTGRRLLMADPANTDLFLADFTNQFDGESISSYIERIAIPFPVQDGGPPDMRSKKFFDRLYPRISGTTGGVVRIYFGTQEAVDGPVTWGAPQDFIIGTTRNIGIQRTTVLAALRFESVSDIEWRLNGYEIEVKKVGN